MCEKIGYCDSHLGHFVLEEKKKSSLRSEKNKKKWFEDFATSSYRP